MENSNVLQVFFKNSVVIISLTTALLYFHGYADYSGTLNYWGVPIEMFPLTTEHAIVQGVNVYMAYAMKGMKYVGLGLLYVTAVYGLVFVLLGNGPRRVIKSYLGKIDSNEELKGRTALAASFFQFLFNALVVILVLLMFWKMTYVFRIGGANRSQHFHEIVSNKDVKVDNFELARVEYDGDKDGPRVVEGYVIISSEKNIAFYSKGKVILLPQSKVHSIEFLEK